MPKKIQFIGFLLIKFWIRIFKISTIVESLVTLPSYGTEEGVDKMILSWMEGAEGAGAFAWALGVGACPAFLYGSQRNR